MTTLRSGFALLLLAALAVGCTPPPKATGQGDKAAKTEAKPADGKKADSKKEAADDIVIPKGTGPIAKVNGEDVPRAEFDAQVDKTRARFKRAGRKVSPELVQRLRDNLVRKYVDEALIAQAAKKEGVAVDQAALDKKFSEHRARFGNEKAFANFLKRTNQTEEDIKRDLNKQLLRDALFEKMLGGQAPTEADAKTYYEQNQAKYKERKKADAAHILFKVKANAPTEADAAAMKKAKDVLKKAKKKGADFAALAREFSEGPTAKKGGSLGKFTPGRMVKPFEDAVFNAKAGDVVGPVKTKFGYHVIKINELTEERQRPFDEVKDSILASLKARRRSQAHREVMTKLRAEGKVEVLEPGVDLERRKAPKPMAGMKPGAKRPQIDVQALKRKAMEAAKKGHAKQDGAGTK